MTSKRVALSALQPYVGSRISATLCDGWDDYWVNGILISVEKSNEGTGWWVEVCDTPSDCEWCEGGYTKRMPHGGFCFEGNELVDVYFE